MEEAEIPLEDLQEKINETAAERKEEERWTMYVALTTACMAVLAAIAGLLSGHHSNEAVIDQIKSSDAWNYYQAKSIKSEVLSSTYTILHTLAPATAVDTFQQNKIKYEKEKDEIKAEASEHAKASAQHLEKHVTLSKAVTIFQIAIAISAIAIITRRKPMWVAAILLSVVATVFLVLGIL